MDILNNNKNVLYIGKDILNNNKNVISPTRAIKRLYIGLMDMTHTTQLNDTNIMQKNDSGINRKPLQASHNYTNKISII